MERTIIQWNIENWLTVVLMVAIFYAAIGGVIALVKPMLPGQQDAA